MMISLALVWLALQIGAVAGSISPTLPLLPRREAAFLLPGCTHVGIQHHTSNKQVLGFASHGCNIGWLEKTRQITHGKSSAWSLVDSLRHLRGGGMALKLLPTPSSGAILIISKVVSAYIMLIGCTCAFFAPASAVSSALKEILDNEVEEDSFDFSLIQSIGAIVFGFAMHVYLALSYSLAADSAATLSLDQAMGYALLPRITLILWSFLRARLSKESKGEYQFQGTSFLKLNFFMMSWSAFSLLTGAGNPAVSAKVFSVMALIKAMALLLNPAKMTEKIFGVNVSETPQSCSLSRVLGAYLAVHAVLMLSLACGVNPNAAVGWSVFAWIVLPSVILLDIIDQEG